MLKKVAIVLIPLVLACEPGKESKPGSSMINKCEFGLKRVPDPFEHYPFHTTTSALNLTDSLGFGAVTLPTSECWAFANGPVFFSTQATVTTWAYGGWWDGEVWVSSLGAMSFGLPAGNPVQGEGLFREFRFLPRPGGDLDKAVHVAYADDVNTIIAPPIESHAETPKSAERMQMPPGLPFLGRHRLLFPGGAYEVDVSERVAVPLVEIHPPARLMNAPDDTTIETISVRFRTRAGNPDSNRGLGIPVRPLGQLKSVPLLVELLKPAPGTPEPYWRFVESNELVSLPSQATWLVRGPCLMPLVIPVAKDPAPEGRTIDLYWDPIVLQLRRGDYHRSLHLLGNEVTDPTLLRLWNDLPTERLQDHFVALLDWGDTVEGRRVHGCDVGMEIEGEVLVADMDLHAGGYVLPLLNFPSFRASFVPFGWEVDGDLWRAIEPMR